jgi:DNA primase catalytic core
MARIPAAELERVKRDVSLVRLVEQRGVALRQHGADLIGRCPFHDDHNPSLVVTPATNLWHCLGACQRGGSVIDWVMVAAGVSFRHAVELLRADTPSLAAAAASSPAPKRSTIVKLPAPVDRDADDRLLLTEVVDYYHATLKQSPEALRYLAQRGLQSGEMIDHFRLGFADRTLGYRLPAKTRQAGAELRGRLQRLGILRASGHEHFNGSIVIPICDSVGDVAELYGRRITPNLRPGTPLHLYLPGPHRGVWNLDAVRCSSEVILCEALLDALTFWCAGFRNVTAAYGIEGCTAEHRAAFQHVGTKRVLIAYDRDEAGERAAAALAAELVALGIAPFRIQFPKGMDANEYARKVQPAERSLRLLVEQAAWMGQDPAPARDTVVILEQGTADPVTRVSPAVSAPPADDDGEYELAAPDAIAEHPAPASPRSSAEAPPLAAEPAAHSPSSPAVSSTPSLPMSAPHVDVPTEVTATEVVLRLGDRRYRVRGLPKNLSFDQLRVNILASRGEGFFVDTLDLYSARHRAAFVKEAAREMAVEEETSRRDLGLVLLKLEELQEAAIARAVTPRDRVAEMPPAEREAALALLRDPDLPARISADFARCGVVGEATNTLVGYLATVSRKLEAPLAVIIQSSSAAGKSALMDAILALVPEEECVRYSAMTGQSLFYVGEQDLRHKVLAIVEQAGAERAAYALKLLQSEGELTIASTGKDPETGKLVTHEYRVEGPVAVFLTTTAATIDEELVNRALVLTVDEDRDQTRAIHRQQREAQTLEGLLARQTRETLLRVHQNAQRLLRPLLVANPYARQLTFLDHRTRTRRDHGKYLTLIRAIALLHQYQRPIHTVMHDGQPIDYIDVTPADIAVANRLAHEVLGRSLDELAPQTRRLLDLLDAMVRAAITQRRLERTAYRFTRKDVRNFTGWSYEQVRVHLGRLLELEYVVAHRGGRGQTFLYELVYDGQGHDGAPFLSGLLDVARLRAVGTATSLGGRDGGFGVAVGAHPGPIPPGLGSARTTEKRNDGADFAAAARHDVERTDTERDATAASYPNVGVAIAPGSNGV